MSDPTQAAQPGATSTDTSAQATPPAATEPVPGSAEHRAAMIAAYDAQFVKTDPAPAAAATQAQTAPPTQETATGTEATPKLTDPPADQSQATSDEAQPGSESKDPAETQPTLTFEQFSEAFRAEALGDEAAKAFATKLGYSEAQVADIHKQFQAGQQALAREQTRTLHDAAGGKEQFNALVAWGQANLTAEQKVFYDRELNGPNAADTIALLSQRMNTGRDPKLHQVNGSVAPAAVGFRDKSEMTAAMSDKRYQTSEAYRTEVANKLRNTRF